MIRSSRAAGGVLIVSLLPALAGAAPAPAAAVFGSNVHEVPAAEVVGIGAITASALAVEAFFHAPQSPRWTGPILFDGAARDALGASTSGGQSTAGTFSDIGQLALAAYPIVVDAGLVTWLSKGKGDVARRLALIDAEALAINGLLTSVVQRSVGRQRPFAQGCGTGSNPACPSPDGGNTAFFSGHTSFAFTGAALLCVQHARLDLYGGADGFVCPVALIVASATGLLRIVADRHWASDVIAGAAVGAAVGTVVSFTHISQGSGTDLAASGSPAGASFAMRF